MRSIPNVLIFDLDQPGCIDWRGSLADLCRANRDGWDRGERRAMLSSLRTAGRCRMGGGAAPLISIQVEDGDG